MDPEIDNGKNNKFFLHIYTENRLVPIITVELDFIQVNQLMYYFDDLTINNNDGVTIHLRVQLKSLINYENR
tara:strand:- start:1494 stop:1709 length:216 start_codon:yes stop_codon:yes gene_type:complete